MIILVINGNDGDLSLDTYVQSYIELLKTKDITVKSCNLRELFIKQCTGCCACMVKTPGICALKDDQQLILKDYISSDAAIIFAPLRFGFINAATKIFLDRMFPLELPYIDFKNGKMHHKLRYEKYPKMGFVFRPETDTDNEDIELNRIYARHLGDYYNGLVFAKTTETAIQELVDETIGL
jgi:multimeric flavodoxin WrbA